MRIEQKVIKNILGTRRKRKDSDGDGVPDWKDCQPHNTMRQDAINPIEDIATPGMARLRQNLERGV